MLIRIVVKQSDNIGKLISDLVITNSLINCLQTDTTQSWRLNPYMPNFVVGEMCSLHLVISNINGKGVLIVEDREGERTELNIHSLEIVKEFPEPVLGKPVFNYN